MENLPDNPDTNSGNQFNFDFITEVASSTFISLSNNEKEVKLAVLRNSEKESTNELEKFKYSLEANYKIKDKALSHQNFKEKSIILSVIGLLGFSVFLIYSGNPLGFEILKLSTTAIISFYAGSAYGKKNSQKEK